MSYVMAIALICGSRFEYDDIAFVGKRRDKCAEQLLSCYEKETGDLDTRLIKCIRKGN